MFRDEGVRADSREAFKYQRIKTLGTVEGRKKTPSRK